MSDEALKHITRRHFFKQAGYGIGSLALSALLNDSLFAAAQMTPGRSADPFAPKLPPLPAKAKNVIFLFMAGAPSQLDLFDNKPKLKQYNGQDIPAEFIKGERFAFIKGTPKILGSPYKFSRHGKSGQEISSLLPHLGEIADDIAIVRSMHTDQFNHAPGADFYEHRDAAHRTAQHGLLADLRAGNRKPRPARLCRAALRRQNNPDGGKSCWSSGFLPTRLSGRGVPLQGRSGSVRLQPGRHERRGAPSVAGRPARPEFHAIWPMSATRRSPPASRPTNWPTGCRPAFPT